MELLVLELLFLELLLLFLQIFCHSRNCFNQMAINGKRFGITDEDILACAQFANMRERKARAVLDEVRSAVREWPRFAAEAEVREDFAAEIAKTLGCAR